MTHFSFKYFLRFAWGIFTGEILLFHNLHLSPGTDLQYKDKKDEQVTTEELMRIKKITGHYLLKDYSTHMEHYAKFEDKPKHKTALQIDLHQTPSDQGSWVVCGFSTSNVSFS